MSEGTWRNLPNLITGSRLVLALLLFGILTLLHRAQAGVQTDLAGWVRSEETLLLNLCLAIFLLAAISDVADGQIARRWGLQTDFGRIVDPFADKVIVCGAFVELVPLPGAHVAAWMVVLILARELLVDGLRGFAESRGVAFGATLAGKAKMSMQCVCLCWIFFQLANLAGVSWAETVTIAVVWTTIGVTLLSGLAYVLRARRVLAANSLARLSGSASS